MSPVLIVCGREHRRHRICGRRARPLTVAEHAASEAQATADRERALGLRS